MPLGSTGMSTMKSFQIWKGMSLSRMILSGTRCCAGAWRDMGSQSSLSRIALDRLQMDSAVDPHLEGQGAPQNVSPSIIKAQCLQM